jgi:hypothetical protein
MGLKMPCDVAKEGMAWQRQRRAVGWVVAAEGIKSFGESGRFKPQKVAEMLCVGELHHDYVLRTTFR